MALSTGYDRIIALSKESTFGTKPARNSAQIMRRTSVDISPAKDSITSAEIRDDFQRVEFRHGIRRVSGSINTEIGLGTQFKPLQSLLRRDFSSNSSVTVTAAGGRTATLDSAGTLTFSSGSLITDGFNIGDVCRLTGSSTPAALLTKNIRITDLSATVLTSPDITASGGPFSSNVTVTVVGKSTYMPVSSHTSDSYSLEVYQRLLDKSVVYKGLTFGSAAIEISPGAMATAKFDCIGQDYEIIEESGASSTDVPYFQSPSAAGTGTLVAGPNGTLRLGTEDIAIVTGMTLNINNNISADPVIGSTKVPAVFFGGQTVNGQMTLYQSDFQSLKDFDNEAELSFQIVMQEPVTSGAPGFFSIYLPRLKLSGFSMPDATGPIIQTVQFEALRPKTTPSNGRLTQIVMQDSSL